MNDIKSLKQFSINPKLSNHDIERYLPIIVKYFKIKAINFFKQI